MKAKWFSLFLIFAMLAIGVVHSADAGNGAPVVPLTTAPSGETGEITDETPHMWFVEMTGAPVADGNTEIAVNSEHKKFREDAKKQNTKYKERYSYKTLWNGFSVSASTAELGKLSRISGVKAIYPVSVIPAPQTIDSSFSPEIAFALAMTGADVAQSELGYTGAGIKVAVMDTGIDYDHPDLGGGFGPGYRVAKGWDFVGDFYNANDTSADYNPVPSPDPDPDDCNGHGTHVAGIIGANGDIQGVAPNVTFGAYRVFGCEGSTSADIMLAAMERALQDGMQVLNMSIGSSFQWPQYPTALAASRLVSKGMVVVASIGNDGAYGLYAAGAPGLGEKVIGVASFDNTHVNLGTFTISPDDTPIGYGEVSGSPLPPTSGTYPMARTSSELDDDDACSGPSDNLTGKVALIRRGSCNFHTKALNAQNSGAIAVVIFNNLPGRFAASVAGNPEITIPVVTISDEEGELIHSRLGDGDVDLTWTDQSDTFVNSTGGLISSFSSCGLSPDLTLKPDIGAPGGLIRSTYPLESGGYATLSGTSMSSPHVAGAVALLLQSAPSTKAEAVCAILQNSAEPAYWWGDPDSGYLENVHRQGAGMLQIDNAIMRKATIAPGKLSLGESQYGPVTRTLQINNNTSKPATYDLSYVNALSTSGIIIPDFYSSNARVTFNKSSVAIKSRSKAEITATITAPTFPYQGQYGGYIILTPRDCGQIYRIPFAGFVGDYQSIEVLANLDGLPWLTDVNWWFDPAAPFTLVDSNNMPYLRVHLDHQSRIFKMEAFNAATGKSVGTILQLDYMVRNSTTTGIYSFVWDGTTTISCNKAFTAPNGQYTIKLSILKALGNSSKPSDWETWTSPVFEIARP